MSESSPKVYPHGVPFELPRQVAGREVGLWHWTLLLLAGATLGLLALAGAGVFVFNQVLAARRAEHQAVTDNRDPVAPFSRAERAGTPVVPPPQGSNPAGSVAGEGGVPPRLPAAPVAGVREDRVVQALDELCTAHLYQSHFNVCLLADAVEKEVYPQAQADKFLDAVLELMDKVDRQLVRLADLGLQPQEQKKLERVERVASLLRTEAKALRTYWKSGDEEDAKRFHKTREAAWAAIQESLAAAK
jgi:hypothetical protein